MAEVIFGYHGSRGWSFASNDTVDCYRADQTEEVVPLLAHVERQALAGKWVALMLSYEAAPAFDPVLKTHPATDFPLAWAAVFNGPNSWPIDQAQTSRIKLNPEICREDYFDAISRIRNYIAQGDTYQVNFTFPFTAQFNGDPLSLYNELCHAQESDYSAYLDIGDYKVLSISPELFFERHGDRVRTRPMKGTIRRGRWTTEDEEMAERLKRSVKDRAENVMIVDLLRNDLGKICKPGSVDVTRLFELERYPTLWQLTSTVEGTLQAKVSLAELISALFPCGSITGAPKIRTMEIIRELEGFPRNVYTGTIGLIRPGGDCVFNVAIRTLLLETKTASVRFGVGGGITYDSDAESEYEECLLKSSFLKKRRPQFQLLESILAENGDLFLLDRHIARLQSSAEYFGFQFVEEQVLSELRKAVQACANGSYKVRLLLSSDGKIQVEVASLELMAEPLRVGLASKELDVEDPFLFHKTTNRLAYEDARSLTPDCDETIYWSAGGEITESTRANVVVEIDGELCTPPQSSGLLAGTFREELLERGEIKERAIKIDQLRQVKEFFLINSVRRWMRAVLIE
jgi:para-aminobenzoate synthetase/4-amino-4-deoxychorismate lyase